MNDDVRDDLRVRAGVENSPFQLQFLLERLRIDQSAVEGKGHGALDVADNQRLHVRALRGAGGIQYMANRHAAAAQVGQYLLIKGVRHQADIAVGADHAVIVDRNAAALLASVLQGVERHVGVSDNAWGIFRRENSENTARFMNLIKHQKFPFPVWFQSLYFLPSAAGKPQPFRRLTDGTTWKIIRPEVSS